MDTQNHILARMVRELIVSENRGTWPTNYRQWKNVAKALGMSVWTIKTGNSGQTSFAGLLLDDEIYVRHVCDPILHRWIAHEITEAILRRELAEPHLIVSTFNDDFHEIARLVERGEGIEP